MNITSDPDRSLRTTSPDEREVTGILSVPSILNEATDVASDSLVPKKVG